MKYFDKIKKKKDKWKKCVRTLPRQPGDKSHEKLILYTSPEIANVLKVIFLK